MLSPRYEVPACAGMTEGGVGTYFEAMTEEGLGVKGGASPAHRCACASPPAGGRGMTGEIP